jgi:hypothetical protein
MLGFNGEVYRREPLCRVYVNEMLVDEFNIPHTPRKDIEFEGNTILDPTVWSQEQYQLQANPPFLKYLELDDGGGHSLDLRVEIQNNDNNYANGFMTKHTLVRLSQCWVTPVKVWEEYEQIYDRWKFSRHNWQKCFGYKTCIGYYLGRRNFALENLAIHADMHFPNITQQLQSEEQLKSHYSNYQHQPQIWQEFPSQYWTGTSGYFHLILTKKLGFWRHSTDRRRGYWKLSLINNVKDLHDKYKSYEDTGNINQ